MPGAEPDDSPILDDLPLRHPILAGTLHSFDRRSGKHLWQSEWGHWAFPLEQPAAGPVLVLSHHEKSKDEGTYAVIRCLDKKTGKEIFRTKPAEVAGWPRWFSRPDEAEFELNAHQTRVRFRYE